MLFSKIARYYHTLRPLKCEQIWFRLKYRLLKPKVATVEPLRSLGHKQWSFESLHVSERSLWENGEVRFLNKSAVIRHAEDWNDTKHDKLWLYNLHYFDDLSAQGAERRVDIQKAFILQWIEQNPAPFGNGWEPYPISLRLVNWVKWCQRNNVYDEKIITSIHQQAELLMQRLEYHILGNHLFANAKALCFVGSFLADQLGSKYLGKGLELLEREVEEQFLADGGHFELSPMYHCILLWDLLDLFNLANVAGDSELSKQRDRWRGVIQKGLNWLNTMNHPDGDISFFNDAAFKIAPSPSALLAYAQLIGISPEGNVPEALVTLKESGYSRLESGPLVLFFDHAEVGPSYLPGHAHADTLSVELSVYSQRVFVNSGTSEYGTGNERQRQRSTAAHNTIQINEENSSDVWAGFRVGRRAHIVAVDSDAKPEKVRVTAVHNGYCFRYKGLSHTRTCIVSKDTLVIEDKLGTQFTSAKAYFHLHPEVKTKLIHSKSILLTLQSGQTLVFNSSESIRIEPTTWHPEFGKSVATSCLVIDMNSTNLVCELTLGT